MLKKNILILLLGAVCGASSAFGMDPTSPLLCRDTNHAIAPEEQRRMEPVQECEDYSTITTQDGKDFKVPDKLLKLSETIKNLLEDAANDTVHNAIPLPTITASIWQKIQGLLQFVENFEEQPVDHQKEKDAIKQEIKAQIQAFDGADLMDFIAATNYLDIPLLLELAIDVAKQTDIKNITSEQIAALPREIRYPITLGQMTRLLGPVPGIQLSVCNGHTDSVRSVCVTADNKIVSGSHDGTVRVWDMAGNQLSVCNGHTNWVNSVCVTADNKIVSGSSDGTVRVWDMAGNQLSVCNGHTHWVSSVCVTPDNKIVSGSWDRTVRVWDMAGNQLSVCNGHTDNVSSVCVTSDNKIVSGSIDRTVRVWDMAGNQLSVCNGHTDSVSSVCVTPDNKIVSGASDGTVRVWDMAGNQLSVCNGHTDWVGSVCVTPDNKIISGSSDRTVRVWDMAGNQLSVCNGHTNRVISVCVTPDNKIVSGASDGTVRVWDMAGNQLSVCNGHTDWVGSVCVTPDNKIVSGSDERTVRGWDVNWLSQISAQQVREIWNYLQGDHKKDWNGVKKILGLAIDTKPEVKPTSLMQRAAVALGTGAALGVLGWCAYKWLTSDNSNN
ncbi:MAG: hypothetical protein AB7F19_03345 [Candidatus Babeliales bacterium]